MRPLPLLDPARSAVLVVDVQNDFCEPAGAAGCAGLDTSAALAMIPTLQHFLGAAREHGAKVVFVQTIHEPATDSAVWLGRRPNQRSNNCLRGSWGAEFTGIAPLAHEPVVVKHRYSAFVHTRLDSVLRTLGVQTIITLGVSTNVCVESTARHGMMLDYQLVMVSDCSAAYDPAVHEMTLRNVRKYFGAVATSREIVEAWAAARTLAPVGA